MSGSGSRSVTTAERIRRFIEDHVLEEPFNGVDPLAETELDSLGTEQLIDFLEDEYGFLFTEEELSSENFASVPSLAALVDARARRFT